MTCLKTRADYQLGYLILECRKTRYSGTTDPDQLSLKIRNKNDIVVVVLRETFFKGTLMQI